MESGDRPGCPLESQPSAFGHPFQSADGGGKSITERGLESQFPCPAEGRACDATRGLRRVAGAGNEIQPFLCAHRLAIHRQPDLLGRFPAGASFHLGSPRPCGGRRAPQRRAGDGQRVLCLERIPRQHDPSRRAGFAPVHRQRIRQGVSGRRQDDRGGELFRVRRLVHQSGELSDKLHRRAEHARLHRLLPRPCPGQPEDHLVRRDGRERQPFISKRLHYRQ